MKNLVKQDRIILDRVSMAENFNKNILENIFWSDESFRSHREIAAELRNKSPYTVTILIEYLNYKLWNKKEYVKKTRISIQTKYRQLLYEMFFKEYGDGKGNELYGRWLDKYRPVWLRERKSRDMDDYVIINELEPRYKQKILSKFRNHQALFDERFVTERERYYHLPKPFDRVDWRNSYDNLFVWEEDGKKVARRGGSGSSGSRETNSMFSFGFLEMNKRGPVPSYLFLYSGKNELFFIRKFDRLCLPIYDIGSNYDLDALEVKRLEKDGMFLKWTERDKIEFLEVCRE